METIRAFIAAPLPEPILRQLATIQRRLANQVARGSVRWMRPEGIHLTLKFLGDTPTDKLAAIQETLAGVALSTPVCSLTVGGLGCFPDPRRPRVVWVGLQEPTGLLAGLQRAVERAMAPLGFPTEGRGFTPHLTLGRVAERASREEVAQVGDTVTKTAVGTLGDAVLDHLALIRSVLKPSGAEYSILATFALQPPPVP